MIFKLPPTSTSILPQQIEPFEVKPRVEPLFTVNFAFGGNIIGETTPLWEL